MTKTSSATALKHPENPIFQVRSKKTAALLAKGGWCILPPLFGRYVTAMAIGNADKSLLNDASVRKDLIEVLIGEDED